MRITKVAVKKLFGIFDHEIPLNQDSRITIIHGPNGIGKTILLTMTHGLFNSNYKVFSDIPFEEFLVEFKENEGIYIQRDNANRHSPVKDDNQERDDTFQVTSDFVISYFRGEKVVHKPYVLNLPDGQKSSLRRMIDSISELERLGSNRWLNMRTGAYLTFEGIIETYDLKSKLYSEFEPDWFKQIKEKISTTFIQTQRLRSQMITEPARPFYVRRETPATPGTAVEKYSSEIVDTIRTTSDKYGNLSQVKDRSFPGRVIGESSYPEFTDLYTRLAELESKRKDFMKLGLLDVDEDTPDIPKLSSDQKNSGRDLEDLAKVFFSTYVQDIEEKLSVFDEISEQLTILTDTINDRFKNKKLTIDKQDGFILARDDQRIPIASLSSGEQHELVLFYQLLFHVKPNSLILIDEPELSLHVAWQRNFLNDIQRITELRKFDVLMATHSPLIIQDKWDWMVALDDSERDW